MLVRFADQTGSSIWEVECTNPPVIGAKLTVRFQSRTHWYEVVATSVGEGGSIEAVVTGSSSNTNLRERILPESDQELLLGYEMNGKNYSATARMYGCSESAVRRRITSIRDAEAQ